MRELFIRFRRMFFVGLAVVLPLFSLYYHGKMRSPTRPSAPTTPIETSLIVVTSPVQALANTVTEWVGEMWSAYVDLVDVKEENEKLLQDNRVLFGEAMRAKKLQRENGRLQELLGFRETVRAERKIAARVIGKDVSPYFRVVKIVTDAGGDVGVAEGMPVVTHEGLVGRVAKVGLHYCEVMLAVDSRSQVNVKIGGKGVIGVLQGEGDENEYGARFRFLHRSEPVEEFDTVVTSGHDKVFPPDLVVGYVDGTDMRQDGLYYEYKVTPAVNFSTLEEVLILADTSDGVLEEIEADARAEGQR